jgi:hypothetical protein
MWWRRSYGHPASNTGFLGLRNNPLDRQWVRLRGFLRGCRATTVMLITVLSGRADAARSFF